MTCSVTLDSSGSPFQLGEEFSYLPFHCPYLLVSNVFTDILDENEVFSDTAVIYSLVSGVACLQLPAYSDFFLLLVTDYVLHYWYSYEFSYRETTNSCHSSSTQKLLGISL